MAIQTTVTAGSLIGGRPVSEFLLIPFGRVEVERAIAGRSFTFTRKHAAKIVRWFNSFGRELAIDYEHQSINGPNTRADGLAPAAGWIGRLEIRASGLWAGNVNWTPKARMLLASGEYAYHSPVIYWADQEGGDVRSLGPVALTNNPAMREVGPLLAASRRKGQTVMSLVTVLSARPLPGVFKLNPGDAAEPDAGSAAGIIAAIEQFADAVDYDTFAAAISEPLVTAIAEAFDGEDRKVLTLLGTITEWLNQGQMPREIVGGLLLDTPGAETAYRRMPPNSNASAGRRTDASYAALRREFDSSPAVRREFGELETFIAFRKHQKAGHVRIIGRGTRGVLASGATTAPSATRRRGITDAELEREWLANRPNQDGVPIQQEFSDLKTYSAFRKHEQAGHVTIFHGRTDRAR